MAIPAGTEEQPQEPQLPTPAPESAQSPGAPRIYSLFPIEFVLTACSSVA